MLSEIFVESDNEEEDFVGFQNKWVTDPALFQRRQTKQFIWNMRSTVEFERNVTKQTQSSSLFFAALRLFG